MKQDETRQNGCEMNKIIAIIPAGGEMLGNQKRNLALINGTPLLKLTIDYAKSCKKISKIIVATTDQEIADYSKNNGAESFILPQDFARKSLKEVLKHAVNGLKNYAPEFIVFLEATHPLREQSWINKMIDLVENSDLDHIFLAKQEKDNFWRLTENGEPVLLDDTTSIRANKKPLFRELAGLCSVMKTQVVLNEERLGKNVGMIPVSGIYTLIDIKNEEDLFFAEQIFLNQKLYKDQV